jgi:hypothetical protein
MSDDLRHRRPVAPADLEAMIDETVSLYPDFCARLSRSIEPRHRERNL